MNDALTFLFFFSLGIAARLLYLAESALAKKTDLMPVTIILDISTALSVGVGFTLFIILSGKELAPYMFAALLFGYLMCRSITNVRRRKPYV